MSAGEVPIFIHPSIYRKEMFQSRLEEGQDGYTPVWLTISHHAWHSPWYLEDPLQIMIDWPYNNPDWPSSREGSDTDIPGCQANSAPGAIERWSWLSCWTFSYRVWDLLKLPRLANGTKNESEVPGTACLGSASWRKGGERMWYKNIFKQSFSERNREQYSVQKWGKSLTFQT